MAIETPHFAWPFRLNAFGTGITMIEQDTPAEIAQCVAFVVSTEPGELIGTPELGMPDPTFKEGGLTEGELEATLDLWEPRAITHFTIGEIIDQVQEVGISLE